ncbi:type II secretion system F family protein [bacterium]|nr:type II secretion system F family protein [bacterium]
MSGRQKAETSEAKQKVVREKELNLYQVRLRAAGGQGEDLQLYVQAYSPEEIRQQYEGRGYAVVNISELVSKGAVTFASITVEQKAEFCRLLAHLLKAGIPFRQALNTILSETSRPIAAAIPIIMKDLDKGKSVTEAVSRHPGIFDEVTLAVLHTGEKSGDWASPLTILANNFEKEFELRNAVKLSLLYPFIVLLLATGIVGTLAAFSFPKFLKLYNDLGVSLPWPTRVTVEFFSFLFSKLGILFVIAIACVFIGVGRYYRSERGRLRLQSFLLYIRPIGKILEAQSIALFSKTLAILLSGGGLLHESLKIAAKSTTLEKHRRALLGMVQPLLKGEDPAMALEMNYSFTQPFRQQFVVGAATGQLDVMLHRIGEFYEKEVERHIAKVSKLMEPILIIVLGLLIAWLVISMYMPLFSLIQAVED